MTLPGVNSLVSISDGSTKDLIPPPPSTCSIVPQANIDPHLLLNNMHVTNNINTQQQQSNNNTFLPKIHSSPFLVTKQHTMAQHKHSTRYSNRNSLVKQASNRSKYLRDKSVTECSVTIPTLFSWLTEFRSQLGLDMTPCRYPSPSNTLSDAMESFSDDHEIRCYCLPNPSSPLDPYDLIISDYTTATSSTCYYSASPSSILAFDSEGMNGVTSVCRWVWERDMFYSLRRLAFFRQARQRKIFNAWTKFHSENKILRVKKILFQKLYLVRPDYQLILKDILIYLESICPLSSQFYINPLLVFKDYHLKVFWMDLLRTKTISELKFGVRNHFTESKQRIEDMQERIVDMLVRFANNLEQEGFFTTNEEQRNTKFSEIIINRKNLHDLSCFIKLIDLILHQYIRELCLIGAATLLSLLHTSVEDAVHEGTYLEEDEFREMVLELRLNKQKMSGQLQDISHGIIPVPLELGLEEGITYRKEILPRGFYKSKKRESKVREQLPDTINQIVDELKGPSPPLLRVSLQLFDDVTESTARRNSREMSKIHYQLKLVPSRAEISELFSDVHNELWKIALEYKSIATHPKLQKYMLWFHTTSLNENSPISTKMLDTPSAHDEASILPLLDKITPDRVNEFVESTHCLSTSSEEITSHKEKEYRFKPSIYKMAKIKSLRRVRIEEDIHKSDSTGYVVLDNFEKSLVEYWNYTSFDLEENLNDIAIYCDAYQPYCGILNQCVKVLDHTTKPSETWGPEKFGHYLKFAQSQEECVNRMVRTFRSGAFTVDTIEFYKTCKPYPQRIVQDVTQHISKIQYKHITKLMEDIKHANFKLQLTISDVSSCANHLCFLDHMQHEINKVQDEYANLNRYMSIIDDYSLPYPDDDRVKLLSIRPAYNMMFSEFAKAELRKEITINLFSELIHKCLADISVDTDEVKLFVSSQHFLEETSGYESVYLDLSRHMREVEHLLTQTGELQRYVQQLLHQKSTLQKQKKSQSTVEDQAILLTEETLHFQDSELRIIQKEISLKQLLWSTWKKWKDLTSSWYQIELSKLNIPDIQKQINNFLQLKTLFSSVLPQNSLWTNVYLEVCNIDEILPVLACVVDPDTQKRLLKLLREEIDIYKTTLEEFIKLDLLPKKDRIIQENVIAVQERHSKELFNKITEIWSTHLCSLTKNNEVWLLVDVDNIISLLEDSFMNLYFIKSSKFIGSIKKDVETWDVILSQMLATVKTWYLFQQKWTELEAIFSSIEMRHELSAIFRDFRVVDKNFQDFSNKYLSHRNVYVKTVTTSPGVLEAFQSHIVQLERVSRSLDDYLENKRSIFGRLYFLSREELLQVICNPTDTSVLQPFLSKLFGSVQQLQLVSGYNPDISNIQGVVSFEGEVFKLDRYVPVKNTTSTFWIANLVTSLRERVCTTISEAHAKSSQSILEDWTCGPYSGQSILVSLFVTWTLEVEMAIAQYSEDWSSQSKSLYTLKVRWQQQIGRMANTLSIIKRHNHRLLSMSIITILTYFRDVLCSLLELSIFQGSSDYNWCKVLRYYIDDPSTVSSVWVEQFLGRFRYCNEYLGCSPRLVMTPLTERAFRHMSTAMHLNMGTAFFGKTGTGKTETVRDFSKAIGNMCFSYSCTADVGYRMLSQYLSGMCSSGTLCCFDDFHKLSTSVLNVVIHYMQVIKTCRDANRESVLIIAREVPLINTSAYFITMNYTVSGCCEFSAIVLSTLRPCAMFEADDKAVVEVLLYSSGFIAAPLLAKKLSSFCQLAERNLSRESHYNFGMRSIRQIIDLASERKKVFYINWGNVCFPLETIESLLLIRCIQDIIIPRLVPRDGQLFHSLLSDHFPGVPKIFTDQRAVEKIIIDIVQEKKLEKWQPQIQKVIELFLFMKQSTGIMLVGESGTGKTVCLQILARLLDMLSVPSEKKYSASAESGHRILTSSSSPSNSSQNMSNNNMFASLVKSKVFSAQINAKAFSLEEFYGNIDDNNNCSDDCLGIFPKILKSFLSDLNPQEDTVTRRRNNIIAKIEPREMVFEQNKVIYQPRDENDLENSGIPLLRTTNFKAKKLTDSIMNMEVSHSVKKTLAKKSKSSQNLLEDAFRRNSMKKSESLHNEADIILLENPDSSPKSGKLSSYSKELVGSNIEEKHLPTEWRWIVFDGPLDPQWVEHLNPALDDTKVICLNNGERLKISEGVRFIFETESLQFANPSIISRCSIVFLSEKDLGWKPIFNSWLNSLHPSIPEKNKTYLKSIAYYSIPQALELISSLQNKPLKEIPQISYVNTLCNIMSSLVYYLVDNKTFGDVTQSTSLRQWGHHAKSSSIVSGMSGDTHYSTSTGVVEKQTLPLVFEQEEEPPDPFFRHLDPEFLANIKDLPASVRSSLNSVDPASNSSLTYLQQNPDEIMNVISRLYLFSFVWSFGGPLDCFGMDELQGQDSSHMGTTEELAFRGGASGRAKFDQFVYQIFSRQTPYPIDLPNSTRPIFSYYIDLDTGKFALWDSLVLEGEKIVTGIPHSSYNITTKKMEAVFHQIAKEPGPTEAAFQDFYLIPTLDAVRTTFFTCLLAARGYSVLLAGQHASGVSMFMRSAIDLLIKSGDRDKYVSTILGGKLGTNEFENVFTHMKTETESNFYKSEIKLFYHMSASTMQHQIESRLLKRRHRLVGRNGKKLLLFLDDLNAPQCDQFSVSPCMELISSLIDTDGLYERKSGQWRWTYDVITMGTYRLTSNSTKQLTGKFLRRFNAFYIPSPTETTIKHIFGVAINLFLIKAQFHRDIILIADKIVSTLIFLFKSVCEKFNPTTNKPHYVFKIKDLAQVFVGMQQCTPEFVNSSDDLINLFTHECNRVLHDRLTDDEERRDYFDILHNALRIHCKVVISPSMLQNEQVLFGSIGKIRTNKQVSYQPLPPLKAIAAILDEQFIKSAIPYNNQLPVFFDVAVHNIMRICRVLTIPCTNMIMIGLPASGKRSGLSLASHLLGYNIVMPHKDGEYKTYSEFDSLVKQLFRDAGEKGVKSALYLAGRFLEQNLHILSYVAYIITQGCTSQLFSNVEVQEIKQAMECTNIDSVRKLDSLWDRFISRVNANLHVFISVSSHGKILSLLCREYPDVISRCNLNYFAQWPAEDRTSIAMKFLKDLRTDKLVYPSMLKTIAETCSDIYKGVLERIDTLETEQCWQTYATTASFIEMVHIFTSSAKYRFKHLTDRLNQLGTTVNRFSEADQGVKDISYRLERAEQMLKMKEIDLENLLADIEQDKKQFLFHRVKFSQNETENANRAIATRMILDDVAEKYEELRPELEEALREIQLLKKSDIVEIRRYAHPPDIVQQVMTALCLLLQQPSDWISIKQMLATRDFILMIINFEKDQVSDDTLEKLQVYINDPRFHPDNVDRVSGACKSICKWMFAVEKYCKVYRLYEPRRKDYLRSKHLEKETRMELKQSHDKLLEIEKSIRKTEVSREKARREKYGLGVRLTKLKDKLERANFLRKTLEEEQVRCKEMREEVSEKIKTILGDCLISSAGISYLGPFPVRYRQNMLSQWKDMCWVAKIPVSSKYSFSNHLISEEHYDIWYTQGLPRDKGSIENAVLIEKGFRWPLIIDPQQLANKWIEQRERENNLVISDYANVNLSDCIAMAIDNNRPLLIQNIPETLPLSLDSLLLREDTIDNSESISLFEKHGDSTFRLYMTCNLPFPRFQPYVYIRTNVINFSISEESMEDMLLAEAVAIQDPELNQQKTQLLSKLPSCYKELWAIHASIDSILQRKVYDVLDNPHHTNTLASNIKRRDEIRTVISEAKCAQDDINKIKSSYGPIAKRGSLLYSIACDLSQLNHMYHFSIYWFIQFYKNCIKPSTKSLISSPKKTHIGMIGEYKIEKLLNKLTHKFYIQIGTAIFSKHLLPFSLTLCSQLLISSPQREENSLTIEEWNFFLFRNTRGVGIKNSHSATNAISNFLLPQTGEPKPTLISSSIPLPYRSPEITNEMWKRCEELENQLPQAFLSLRQFIILNSRLWKQFMSDPHPFMFNFDPFEVLGAQSELDVIQEEKESEEFEDNSNEQITSSHRPTPKISTTSTKSTIVSAMECDFQPDFLTHFHKLILIKELRKEVLDTSVRSFITETVGSEFIETPVVDLDEAYYYASPTAEVSITPILLIQSDDCTSCKDMVGDLEKLAREKLCSHSMLSQLVFLEERVSQSFATLKRQAMRGGWVLCTNVHLQLTWLTNVIDILLNMIREQKIHPKFRLWLITKTCKKFPISILHLSLKLRIESLKSIRANIEETLLNRGAITEQDLEDQGAGPYWKRLLFSLCFFNAIIHCRNRYRTLGWNFPYDFSVRDFTCGKYIMLRLMTDHSCIPWRGIVESLGDTCYGGRVTDFSDKKRLECLLERYFNSEVTTSNYHIMKDPRLSMVSDKASFEGWKKHIEQLPDKDSPESLGLHQSADVTYSLANNMYLIQCLVEMNSTAAGTGKLWQARDSVIRRSSEILSSLPTVYEFPDLGSRDKDTEIFAGIDICEIRDRVCESELQPTDSPLLIVLDREIEMYQQLLSKITNSIEELQYVKKSCNLMSIQMEELYREIKSDIVPKLWRSVCYPTTKKLGSFIIDLKQRCKFFSSWQDLLSSPRQADTSSNSPAPPREVLSRPRSFWLGSFFNPHCFLTAIKQEFSRQHNLPLESISFQTRVLPERRAITQNVSVPSLDEAFTGFAPGYESSNGVLIHGLYLEGCKWDYHTHQGGLATTKAKSPINRLPPLHFMPSIAEKKHSRKLYHYKMPVYYTADRSRYTSSREVNHFDSNIITHFNLPSVKPPELLNLANAAILLSPPCHGDSN
ncbi:Dynein heavy chain 6, axonemal-like [Oopsacas minuta]|uniref:Dynein heavy chain 6, axonemal-like n=1 Tax=Oopsacas minuta TaxID=111878 RepID=A0AAV7JZ46_9METZ|nr:Dynein heavy chain 6, axonemal-like [Oopsacas minuta]